MSNNQTPDGKSAKAHTIRWKKQTWIISDADYSNLQAAYLEWCNDTESGELWMHYKLSNAFNTAGIRGLDKEEYKKLGGSLW